MKEIGLQNVIDYLPSLLDGIDYDITALSNTSALLNQEMKDINWVGFYIVRNGVLKLGPFQGKVACTEIPFTRGVCGKCAREQKTIRVDDVHQFAGHIACDSASQSEICVPLFKNNELYGLLDIDSPITNRFTLEDEAYLEKIAKIIEKAI